MLAETSGISAEMTGTHTNISSMRKLDRAFLIGAFGRRAVQQEAGTV